MIDGVKFVTTMLTPYHSAEDGVIRSSVTIALHNTECTVCLFAAYRARLHSLPPPEALRSMFPYISDRMRKRRCFADKELEVVMFEREKRAEAEKIRTTGILAQSAYLDPMRSRHLLGNSSPREFLQKVFPTANPNVLELVYQGCGGNLERTIEHLVSTAKAANFQAAQWSHHQQLLLQQMNLAAHGAHPAASSTTRMPSIQPNMGHLMRSQLSAFTQVRPGVILPTHIAPETVPASAMPHPIMPQPLPSMSSSPPSQTAQPDDDAPPRTCSSRSSPPAGGPLQECLRSSQDKAETSASSSKSIPPLKFSVDSIIAKWSA